MTTTKTERSTLVVHRYQATGGGVPVNAYLVEGASGLVAVDATLTVSDGRALRALADGLEKPLLGVVITHPHPDHYGGLVELVRGMEGPALLDRRSDRGDAARRRRQGADPAADVR